MGMFDYVNVEPLDCPNCGKLLSDWQTKDNLNTLSLVDPTEISWFHKFCNNCKVHIVYEKEEEIKEPRKIPYTKEELQNLGFVVKVLN